VHTSLFVCATPRTGSNLLDGLLASTGLVGEPEEDFGAVLEEQVLAKEGRAGLADYLVHCAARAGATGVYATKLHLDQHDLFLHLLRLFRGAHGLADAELIEAMFPHPRFVWLSRKDLVAQAVSWWRARQSGAWIASDEPRSDPFFDFEAIDAAVHRALEQAERWRRWFASERIEPLPIAYEDLVADPTRIVREVLAFAGIDAPADLVVKARITKQADSVSEEWIERYRSLARASGAEPRTVA
jgi:LPS sulfotransferase NodH